MKSGLLFVISLTVLAATASTGAESPRGLGIGLSPEHGLPVQRDLVFAQRQTSVEPGEIFRDCDDCPELVVVPPGDFVMGSNDTPYEKPERTISVRHPFAIGRREVTFAEWDQCADAGACKHRPDDHGWGRGDRPVVNVSWDDSKLYLAWLSQQTGQRYRLPSEAEWEYAARANQTAVMVAPRRRVGPRAVRDMRQPGQPENRRHRFVPAQRLRALRHRRQRRRMGRGLLERQLSRRPQGGGCLDHRRLPLAGLARRQLHQQGQRSPLLGALPLR